MVIAFLTRSKGLLNSWLQSPSAVILEPKICSTIFIWRKKWRPTPVLLPGKSHGWRSLVGYSPWSRKESDTPERLQFTHFILYHWRRKWQHTPVFLPGESQGQRSLVGHGPWRRRESDWSDWAFTVFIKYLFNSLLLTIFFPTSGIWLHRKWGEREYNWTLCYI